MNNEELVFFGIDLSIARPSARAALNTNFVCTFDEWQYNNTADGIIPKENISQRSILAIDGPQGLAGLPEDAMRKSDRLLGAAGKSPYDFPMKGKPYAGFVRGSVVLFYSIYRSHHFHVNGMTETERFYHTVIEVYPGAAWRVLNNGIWLSKKRSKSGREERFNLLKKLGLTFPQFVSPDLPTHDQLDAAVAAYTGYLFANNRTVIHGDYPSEDLKNEVLREGFIVQPEKSYALDNKIFH